MCVCVCMYECIGIKRSGIHFCSIPVILFKKSLFKGSCGAIVEAKGSMIGVLILLQMNLH